MSTPSERSLRRWLSWTGPVVGVLFGVVYLVVGLVGGDRGFAVGGFAIMLAVSALMVVAARYSETAKGLVDRRDERINGIDKDASLVAGMTVMLATLGMFCLEIARGRDGSPYYQLGALGGVAYLAALLWLRFRR